MPVTTFVDDGVISAAEHNANWDLAVLTDTVRTITVTHTWTASQTFSGGITLGGTGAVISITGASTAIRYFTAGNTSGQVVLGVDSSTGGNLFTGGGAYSSGIGSNTATAFHLATNGVVRVTLHETTGAATFTAGLSATTGTFSGALALGTNPASAGAVRIANGAAINSRNGVNGADIGIALVDSSDNVSLGAGATSVQSAVKLGLLGAASAGAGSDVYLGGTTQTTIGANGAASALTAAPLGYLIAYKGATKIIIPYYNG